MAQRGAMRRFGTLVCGCEAGTRFEGLSIPRGHFRKDTLLPVLPPPAASSITADVTYDQMFGFRD